MSEQSVDLRAVIAVLRRHVLTLSAAAVVGAGAGAGLALASPPEYTSASLVLLPPVQETGGQPAVRDIRTDIAVASSSVVLGPAAAALKPPMTQDELARKVTVTAPTENVLRITASGRTAEEAQKRAQQVADSEVAYSQNAQSSLSNAQQAALRQREQALKASQAKVEEEIKATKARQETESPTSTQGQADATALAQLAAQQADLSLQLDRLYEAQQPDQSATAVARVIQDASTAHRPGIVRHVAVYGLLGLATSLLLAVIALVLIDRRDRRLRYRDEMADALGCPVVASVVSQQPRSVAGWTSMLQAYEPGTLDAWALRQVLRPVLSPGATKPDRTRTGKATSVKAGGKSKSDGMTILVITLSEDLRGLTIGPQLASYAASVGVRTRLYAAQRHESAAALWAACHRGAGQEEVRPRLFVDTGGEVAVEPELTVVLAVLDRRNPVLAVDQPVAEGLLCVAAGSATAEDLARAAVAVDDAGCPITGLVVADPDDLDRTTGRLLQHERAQQLPLPDRLTGFLRTAPPTSGPGGVRRPS